MSDKKSLRDLFGDDLTESAKADLNWIGEQAAKDLTKSIYGIPAGEMEILSSPTRRDKTRLAVNLPGSKECFGAPVPAADFSDLELRAASSATKSVSALMQSSDRMIGFERSVATTGQTFQMLNTRTGKETTYEFKDTGDWEETH